jgi:ADP-heptose:LPS heptosyltransferase
MIKALRRAVISVAKYILHLVGVIAFKPFIVAGRKRALKKIPENPKILYVSLAYRGDLILTFPAIRALKAKFPKSFITVWVRDYNAVLTELSVDIDRTLTYDKFDSHGMKVIRELVPKNIHQGFLDKLRRASYNIYIDDSGYTFSSLMGLWANIPLRIGRNQQGFGFLNHFDFPYDHNGHLIKKKIKLLEPLGVELTEGEMLVPKITIPPGTINSTFAKVQFYSESATYFTCSPFAGWAAKNWEIEKILFVVNEFALYSKLTPIFLGGENDINKIPMISRSMRVQHRILFGELNILNSAALISKAAIHFGVDSIGSHLAAASGVKSLTIFGPTNPLKIAILTDKNIAVFKREKCTPAPNKIYCCRDAGRSCSHISCMRELKQEDVLEVLKDLWDGKVKSKVVEL